MFANRKKCFPPGVFIPTPYRALAILQLCFAFTVFTSYIGYPFMGELYEIKSRKVIHDAVMGPYFSSLPWQQQQKIRHEKNTLQEKLKAPALKRAKRSFTILLTGIPPFVQAWILFSVAISLLLLLKIEGAAHAAWLLPLIIFGYAVDNQLTGYSGQGEENLFPSEAHIVNEYLKEPLHGGVSSQREQLLKGWRLYLVKEWAKERPSNDEKTLIRQAEKGQFYFNVARLDAPYSHEWAIRDRKKHPLLLILLFMWNVGFAWFMNRRPLKEPS